MNVADVLHVGNVVVLEAHASRCERGNFGVDVIDGEVRCRRLIRTGELRAIDDQLRAPAAELHDFAHRLRNQLEAENFGVEMTCGVDVFHGDCGDDLGVFQHTYSAGG